MRCSVEKLCRKKVHIICLAALLGFLLVTNHILQKLESSQRRTLHDFANPEMKQKEETLPLRTKKIKDLIQKYRFDLDMVIDDSPWAIAAKWVKAREIHPSHIPELGAILNAMASYPITQASTGHKGTQLKLKLRLKHGQIVAFKPMWYKRDTILSGSPYIGRDRHNGEVAAFHLNRILEFRRAPLVVGRRINLDTEIIPVASPALLKTFFTNGSNTCFYGKCLYCLGKDDGVCADKNILEGVVALWFPLEMKLQLSKHPWARTYKKNVKALWETDDTYCDKIKGIRVFQHSPLLLDILDTAIFDYLIGNGDRHHYERFRDEPDAALLLLDNAKSFGNPNVDETSILAPIIQCCRLRKSTWEQLLIHEDGDLGAVLKGVLENEVISPVLHDPHYTAIDRRLSHVLKIIRNCIHKHGEDNVLAEN
ncbi:glycosaminoglycan xylosylkinase-like [Liolophura sinensis]|uniref:glycosaminoglycan xylosylkinase-like n=1 Tax=Liolophura sinensis TaxID=3198878 RepID=UPI0031590172